MALNVGCGDGGSSRPRTDAADDDDTGGAGGGGRGGTGGGTARGGSGGSGLGGSGGAGGTGGLGGAGGTAGAGGSGRDAAADGAAVDGSADVATPDTQPPDLMPADTLPPVLPPPWMGKDIGMMIGMPGGAGVSANMNDSARFDVVAAGTGIGAGADSFHFGYQQVRGDAEITGRYGALARLSEDTIGGFMFRESLDPDAAMVFAGSVDSQGGKVIFRRQKGQPAVVVPAANATPPTNPQLKRGNWIRLRREGATIKIFGASQLHGVNETGLIGMVDLTLASTTAAGYFGFAVAGGDPVDRTTARVDEVYISNLQTNATTKDWNQFSYGSIGGSALWANNRLSMAGLGHPWGEVMGTSRDFLHFAYFVPTSNVSLQIRVASQTMTDPSGRVAVMFRYDNLDSRSGGFIALSLTEGMGVELQTRPKYNQDIIRTAMVASQKAPLWLRIDRNIVPIPGDPLNAQQTIVAAYFAPDNSGRPGRWSIVGAPFALPLGPPIETRLGIGVSSYTAKAFKVAEISNVNVAPAGPPPPLPDAGAADAAGATSDGGVDR
jgi:hypothetical protein